jgi:hypothetical protein
MPSDQKHSPGSSVKISWREVVVPWAGCTVIAIGVLLVSVLHGPPRSEDTLSAGVHIPGRRPLALGPDEGSTAADEDAEIYTRRPAPLMYSTDTAEYSNPVVSESNERRQRLSLGDAGTGRIGRDRTWIRLSASDSRRSCASRCRLEL